jgi:hypothetical protein
VRNRGGEKQQQQQQQQQPIRKHQSYAVSKHEGSSREVRARVGGWSQVQATNQNPEAWKNEDFSKNSFKIAVKMHSVKRICSNQLNCLQFSQNLPTIAKDSFV